MFGLITDAQCVHAVLVMGQRSLCARSGRSGPLRSQSANLSCMRLCLGEIRLQAAGRLAAWNGEISDVGFSSCFGRAEKQASGTPPCW